MGGIPQQVIDDILDRCDLSSVAGDYVQLKRSGDDLWGCCPFHQEKTPSFKINAARQVYYCFGCQRSGNVFHFIMEKENLDFRGAVQLLGDRIGVSVPDYADSQGGDGQGAGGGRGYREKILKVLQEAAKWFQQQLNEPEGEKARRYLVDRGVTSETTKKFGLGYAPGEWQAIREWGEQQGFNDELLTEAGLLVQKESGRRPYDRFRNRLMFPVCDEVGRVVGFSGRTLSAENDTAKYINTPETRVFHKNRLMYGFYMARKVFRETGKAVICEGQMDVIACHQAGCKNAVAPMGTAFTENHARVMKRYVDRVTFAFDADAAGQKAVMKSVRTALQAEILPEVLALPQGQDPGDVFQREGAQSLYDMVNHPQDGFQFLLNVLKDQYDVNIPEDRSAVVDGVLDCIVCMPNPVNRATRCQWLSEQLNVPERAVLDAMKQRQNKGRDTGQRQASNRNAREGGGRKGRNTVNVVPHVSEMKPGAAEQKALLDMAVHYRSLAEQLAERLPPDELDDSALGQALSKVLQWTMDRGWENAVRFLASDEQLAADKEVGRVLAQSHFASLDPAASDTDEEARRRWDRLTCAMNDCMERLEKNRMKEERREIEQKIPTVNDPEERRRLLARGKELNRRIQGLTP